jgi:hypothetical protein
MMENGQSEERKINGEPATQILVTDEEGGLKQNLPEMDVSLTFILFTEPLNIPQRCPVCKYSHLVHPVSYAVKKMWSNL